MLILVLPGKYIDEIVAKMIINQKLVVVSGFINNEPYIETGPRGSKGLLTTSFGIILMDYNILLLGDGIAGFYM